MKLKLTWLLTLFMAFVMQFSFAQEKTVTGTVTTASDGLPLPGASVVVKGTSRGQQTDFDGKYTIKVNQGDVLEVSYVGMDPQQITIGAGNVYDVALTENALEEVVVVGYGEQSQKKSVQSVAVIDSKSLENIQGVSPQVLLQGQASGVQVVQSSGILGATPVVNIRGTATVSSGSQPLYVVDGVPLNDVDQGANQGANQGLNPLADLNPDDIESFTVLKDAAAVSIYGSRGANGVVIINTKKGSRDGVTRVSVDFNTSYTEATDILEVLTGFELREQFIRAGRAVSPDVPEEEFNWVEGVQQNGFSRKVNASVSGGGEKTTFFMNFTKENAEGFIIGNALKRTSGRVNVATQATDWLKTGINLAVSNNYIDRVGAENSTFAPFTSAYLQNPYVLPRDAEGNFVNTGFIANVIAIEALDINDYTTDRITGNVFAEAKFLNNFTFKSDFGVDRIYLDEIRRSFEINSPGGFGSNTVSQQHKWLSTNTLNYRGNAGSHSVNVLAGIAYERTATRFVSASGTGFASDALLNVISASTPGTTSSSGSNSALYSIFSRATYDYSGRYLLEGTVRRDQSSRFGFGNRNGVFYSGALGWVVSDESFMDNVDFINRLKLTASYGTTGNDRIGNFSSLGLYGSGVGANYNGASGTVPTSISNPDLRWETTKGINLNLSADLFNNRLNLSVDYYNNDTEDLILNVPVADEVGGPNTVTSNVGTLNNTGFDVQIGGTILKSEDFSWYSSLNIGFNTNEITSLPGQNLDANGDEFIQSTGSQRAVKGRSVSEFYLIRYVGVNSLTGDAEWLDANGNVTTTPTADDRVYVGSAIPDYTGGLTNRFTYKGFELSLFANFSRGNDIFIDGLRFTDNPNSGFNKSRRVLNYWQNPGDNAYIPSASSPTFGTFSQRSTSQLRNGSFFRLKNATFAYNLPKKYLDKIGFFSGVRLYATATNLFTIKGDNLEGIDPEVTDTSNSLGQGETFFTPPQSKTYTFGIRLNF